MVVALETGGWWSAEAFSKWPRPGRDAPFRLRRSAFMVWKKRASSLVASPHDAMSGVGGATPDLADLFGSV